MRGGAAGGELDGETDAAAVRGSPPLEAGGCAGGGEPAVDLVDAEADDRIPRFRRDRGVQAADCGRATADQTSHISTPPGRVGLRAADGDYDVVAVAEIDVGPAERGDLAATERPVEQQGDDRAVDQAAAFGGLRALEAAAGAARAEAGGEDDGALVGGETSGQAAAARCVDSVRTPKPLERAPGERPDRHGSAGIAGGTLDGGDHHRSACGRAAGLVKVPQVGSEARVVERSSIEPGVELAAGHGVGAAGVGRRRALEEPDRGLDAGRLDIGEGDTGLAGGHGQHDTIFYPALQDRFVIR